MNNKIIKDIINKHAIIKKTKNSSFFLIDGDGRWVFDFRRVFLKAEFLKVFSKYFMDKYEKHYPFQIGGLETGVIPLIAGIVIEGLNRGKKINSFYVRKDRKLKGLGKKVEGSLNNEKIIIVDDLINSGSSIKTVFDSINTDLLNVFKVFTFVNLGNKKAKEFLSKNNLSLDYEFTLSDFGLDAFGNTAQYSLENKKLPIIFPSFREIFSLVNANKFMETEKSSPIKYNKQIFIGGESGKFISICSDTGNVNWEIQTNITSGHKNILSTPILIKNNVVFGSYDGNLYNIDINDGSIKWKSPCADWIGSSPDYSIENNMIYIGLEHSGVNNKGSIAGINFESGEKKWELFYDGFVHCSPGYSKKVGIVICGSNDGKLLCIDGKTGELLSKKNIGNSIKGGFDFSPDGKTAYFGCFDNYIYAFDLLNFNIKWVYKTNNIVYAKPLVHGDDIFIGSLDKSFYHLNSDGKLLNKIDTYGKNYSKPILIDNNLIVFGSNDSYVYFYDYKNKQILFVIEHKERISTSLIYDNKLKHLYVYDFLNKLYVYDMNGYL